MKLLTMKHHILYMMLRLFYIALFLCSFGVKAQSYIYGEIFDHKTAEPINDVTVSSEEINTVVRTNSEGIFTLNLNGIGKDFTLKFKHQGYESQLIVINKYYRKRIHNDTIYLKVRLKSKITVLPDIIVSAERKPDTIFGNEQESVQDYIVEKNSLILLTYDKTIRKGSQIVLIDSLKNRLEYAVNGLAQSLFTDFRGNHFLISESSIQQIIINQDSIRLGEIDETYFYDIIARITDSTNHKYYYSNFQDIYPAFTYYSIKNQDSIVTEIHSIEDKFMMELYRSEYKYVSGQNKLWAMRQEMKTGIDKEIWIGASYFTSSLYYKSLYAPMVNFGKYSYIFDHYTDYIYKIDTEADTKVDSVSISYHLINGKEKWKQPIIFDREEEKIYALFQKGGQLFLRNIDLETGEITKSFKIHYRFVENIKIVGGKVYYIYRPFESAQKKFIYSEQLD